ncbi:PREDICTED: uncharacterized protein LOC104820741 [Tarenaya hassleriana]|uniref:uncharacterized protein LOC104820741 n=1 Tax=Tarenaya hassleriana TaxID=28532 RepID=UPI00053C79F2|nr:PREDICTED: uncharacterized protein LOC104820741 [Tarenaya hassleriana]
MGALCCVAAAGPLKTRSPASVGRDISSLRHNDDLHWRMNLSFSPSRDSRNLFRQDSVNGPHSSALFLGGSRSTGTGPLSDLVSGSMPANFQQSPRQVSWVNSSASRGSRTMTSQFPLSKEEEQQDVDHAPTAICSSVNSSVSPSESSSTHWESTSKQPFSPSWYSYPRVFCNPVSDCENHELAGTKVDSSTTPQPSFTTSKRNHRLSPSLFQPPRSTNELSPEPSTSSSREEMELNVEMLDTTEWRNQRYSGSSTTTQKCGICKKLLSQKSPWSSYRIMRSGDMPAAGILPCCHTYHVECLDQVTQKAQTRDPPCPVCSKAIGSMEEPLIVPETLQLALRSLRRSRIGLASESPSNPSNNDNRSRVRRRSQRHAWLGCCLNITFRKRT